ncbi:hypothetical protein J7I94_32720 [Streptomyces sp. ISL-12]|uniref:hypothetical protein n=1 Tax=Streptomyces sp. ISL-12 TaxID=2819177 RepID=UPI001BE9054D|nr:hypothetical protein [Streptomyces sp. ISL-12]MBT2415249.1 hypothetical protein [Streptomyces sp. ISL-12]
MTDKAAEAVALISGAAELGQPSLPGVAAPEADRSHALDRMGPAQCHFFARRPEWRGRRDPPRNSAAPVREARDRIRDLLST